VAILVCYGSSLLYADLPYNPPIVFMLRDVLEAVQQCLDKNPQAMRQRRETGEHPFVTLKMCMGTTHFLMKGLPKAATEMALHVLAYNLTRVINIIGVQPLVAMMRGIVAPRHANSVRRRQADRYRDSVEPPMSDLCRFALLGLFRSRTAFLRRQLNVPRSFMRWSINGSRVCRRRAWAGATRWHVGVLARARRLDRYVCSPETLESLS
jgi:hypothetical protein